MFQHQSDKIQLKHYQPQSVSRRLFVTEKV